MFHLWRMHLYCKLDDQIKLLGPMQIICVHPSFNKLLIRYQNLALRSFVRYKGQNYTNTSGQREYLVEFLEILPENFHMFEINTEVCWRRDEFLEQRKVGKEMKKEIKNTVLCVKIHWTARNWFLFVNIQKSIYIWIIMHIWFISNYENPFIVMLQCYYNHMIFQDEFVHDSYHSNSKWRH